MKKRKTLSIFLLILLGLSVSGCGRSIEDEMNTFEDFINRIEERSNDFFDRLGDSVDDVINRFTDYINDFNDDREDHEVEGQDPETITQSPGSMTYVSRKMDEAFSDLPQYHDYEFDVEAENYILERLNTYRAENNLHPLERREDLSQSARYKSLAMLQHDYFSHDNPNLDGRPFDYLMWDKLGLKYVGIGENLAFVSNSGFVNNIEAEELFVGWQNSDGHNRQMLSPTHRFIGVGVVRSNESGKYFKGYKVLLGTQHFGN